MEKPLQSTCMVRKLGGAEPQGVTRVGQTEEPGWCSLRYGACLPALWLCGRRSQKRNSDHCQNSLGKVAAQLLPGARQLGPFFPICLGCLLVCCPHAGAQREWICLGLQQFVFHSLNPLWFLQPKLWQLLFLVLEPWAEGPDTELGPLAHEIALPILSASCGYGTILQLCPSYQPCCSFSSIP